MDWINNQVWSQVTVPSLLTTLTLAATVIHKEYMSNGPLRGKKMFRHLLVQNLTQADITISCHIQSENLIDYFILSQQCL
jgi:hypothetical protein